MLQILLITVLLLALYIANQIYLYFKRNDAPILRGNLICNISYKKGQKLDLYQPTTKIHHKAPVLIYFHGGGWVFGSKKAVNNARFNAAFNHLREQGYAIISPSYTLAKSGKSPFPACIDDANHTLLWIEQNADKYNFDIDNIGIMGESAGAHIGMMSSYGSVSNLASPHSLSINYMISIYGPTELFQLYKDLMPFLSGLKERAKKMPGIFQKRFNVAQNLFGFNPINDADRTEVFAKQYSPYHKLTKTAPNTLIIHGDRDQLVPISQSLLLKERLDALGIPNMLKIFKGVGHALRGATFAQRQMIQNHITGFVLDHYTAKTDAAKSMF